MKSDKLAGTYCVSVQTPIGFKRGTVSLRTLDSAQGDPSLAVDIKVPGLRFSISNATCSEDQFEIQGRVSHMLGSLLFRCTGYIEGDRLVASATSGAMGLRFEGVRVNPRL